MKLKPNLLTFSIIAAIVVIIIVAVIGVMIYSRVDLTTKPEPVKPPVPPQETAYKIKLQRMKVIHGKIGNNQNLSSILSGNVSPEMIDHIAKT